MLTLFAMEGLEMNENPQVNRQLRTKGSTGTTVVMGFVLGALVGAGMALLLAPETGKDTRKRLVATGRRWSAAARSTFQNARDTANDLKQDAMSAVEAGREAFEENPKPQGPYPSSRIERNV
jgi:gas vesicle protein